MEQILVVPDFTLVLYLRQAKRAMLFFERKAEEPAAERRRLVALATGRGRRLTRI